MRLTATRTLLASLALALAWAGGARAGSLSVSIQETGFTADVFTAPSGTSITLSGAYSNAAPDFFFPGFTASSTLGSSEGQLLGTGTIESLAPGSTLTILISDDGYTAPAGPNYTMGSSSSYSGTPFGSLTFQSFATPGQSLFGMTITSAGTVYNPLASHGSNDEPPTSFSSSTGYTLTQKYVWTSGSALLNLLGSTVVANAVPEPSSLVLFGLGSIGLIVVQRRRFAKRSIDRQPAQS
jgi:PEP-CTERM motif